MFRKRKQKTKRFKNRVKALRSFRMIFYQKEVTTEYLKYAQYHSNPFDHHKNL